MHSLPGSRYFSDVRTNRAKVGDICATGSAIAISRLSPIFLACAPEIDKYSKIFYIQIRNQECFSLVSCGNVLRPIS